MFSVNGAHVPLWSEVQVATEGHCIYRDRHPDNLNGKHCVGFRCDNEEEPFAFAPYPFDKDSVLWCIKVTQATQQHVDTAWNYDANHHPIIQLEQDAGLSHSYHPSI